jgi:hypothetical protein
VYGVRALNAHQSQYFYEELAEASGGHYLKLGHFDVITDMFLAGELLVLLPFLKDQRASIFYPQSSSNGLSNIIICQPVFRCGEESETVSQILTISFCL